MRINEDKWKLSQIQDEKKKDIVISQNNLIFSNDNFR